ncbi:MAG: type III-B CRISPR module-associated protein Cmr5 [Candidatus Nezhaarchaeota archaeon]|nr:type III-B CRISPR module-associated protein Cmr5 [Candidatus Nezhaarchaeota archaeon]
MSDRLSATYKHAWRYVALLKRLHELGEELKKDSLAGLKEKFVSYSERLASFLEREGVLSTLGFIVSKSSARVVRELVNGPEEAYRADRLTLEELGKRLNGLGADEVAYSILYDCCAKWLVELGLISAEDYKKDHVSPILQIAEGFSDLGLKHLINEELSRLAIAIKQLAAGGLSGD